MKIKILFSIFSVLLFSFDGLAQTQAQIDELEQINRDIDKSYHEIAKSYAYIQVYDFFKGRFKFIHQTNLQCLVMFEKVEQLAQQLSKPDLINQTYSSPEQAYASLEVLTNLMLYDQTIFKQILDVQNEFKLQKEHIKDTQKFLTISDESILDKFPRPDDLDEDYGYKNYLIKAYREVVSQNTERMNNYVAKCGNADLNLDAVIQKRKDFFSDFAKKLGDYYVENYTEKFMSHLKDLAKPSAEISLMLNIESVFNRLDRKYRDAALYDKDYLTSMSIIDSYESIAFIILAKILPLSSDANQRSMASEEIKRRIQNSKNFIKILQKEKPSYWLKQRLELVQSKIKNKTILCDQKCNVNLIDVEKLISASKLMENVSTEQVYIVLGNQLLDNIR